MKKHFPKIIAVTLGVAALAVSVPVSAFAKSSKPLSYLYTYQLTFDGYDTMSLSPDDTGTITAPALPEGAQYWQCNGKHVMPGEQFSYDQLDDWLCPSVDIDDGTGTPPHHRRVLYGHHRRYGLRPLLRQRHSGQDRCSV